MLFFIIIAQHVKHKNDLLQGSGKCKFITCESKDVNYSNSLVIKAKSCEHLKSNVNVNSASIECEQFILKPPFNIIHEQENRTTTLYLTKEKPKTINDKNTKSKNDSKSKPKSNDKNTKSKNENIEPKITYNYSTILLLNFYAFRVKLPDNTTASIYKLGEATKARNPIELSELMYHINNIKGLTTLNPIFYPLCLSINLGFENANATLKKPKNMGYLLDDLEFKGQNIITCKLQEYTDDIYRMSDNNKKPTKNKKDIGNEQIVVDNDEDNSEYNDEEDLYFEEEEEDIDEELDDKNATKKPKENVIFTERLINKEYSTGEAEMFIIYNEPIKHFQQTCRELLTILADKLKRNVLKSIYKDVEVRTYNINLNKYKNLNIKLMSQY